MIPVFTLCTFLFLWLSIIVIVFEIGNKVRVNVWLIFFLLSLIFAVIAQVVTMTGVLCTMLVGGIAFLYSRQKKIWQALLLLLVSLPLFFHLPQSGFHNYAFLDHVRVTPDAIPYSLYFNYDKTIVPIFVMGFSGMVVSKEKWREIRREVFMYLLFLAPLMLGLSWLLEYVRFSPKWPAYTPVWMLVNLFFTCTAEEVLFRKIIQGELEKRLKIKCSGVIAIVISAVLFGGMHFMGGIQYILLATAAGLFYGHIFYKTKEIRSSVFLHFLLNTLHFLLFTYPALQK